MVVEVYASGKPAIPRRALFASIFLLVAASALAAAMAWHRSGELLARGIEPPGWSISFRPPRRFHSGQFGSTKLGSAFLCHGRTRAGAPAALAVYHLEGAVVGGAQAVCERVLRAHAGLPLPTAGMTHLTRFDKKLGRLDAAEIRDEQLGVVVRAVVLDSDDAYAVSLSVDGADISEDVYRLFDLTCSSIEYRTH